MKICIIKLGADGDVLRTIPLARALKGKYEAEIHWITKGDISSLLSGLREIDKIYTLPYNENLEFDALYNFDIDKDATDLAGKIKAKKKYGFFSREGFPAAFNVGAEYYLNTVFDDELKKSNRRTYQEMMFEAAELEYNNEKYGLVLNDKDKKYADEFVSKNNIKNDKLIGIHLGASSRWPSKAWHSSRVEEFISLAKNRGYEILLFGGPNEADSHKALCEHLNSKGINIYRNNTKNSKREFAALVSICKYVVCSDSFALHVSVGLGKRTIALFFCTSPWEVEDYGLVKKIVSPMLKNFFPERSDEYNEALVKSIDVREVFDVLER